EIYPDGPDHHTRVSVPGLSERYCGAGRPGHFDGVATVVTKLFHIVAPDVAVFGQKDFQQLQVIRKMTRDLCLPVEIVSGPTRREADGLAMSSRNGYLSSDERARAPAIHRALGYCAEKLAAGDGRLAELEAEASRQIRDAGLEPEYVAICDPETLLPPAGEIHELVILAAARLGGTRLIDNMTVHC
ncbi:MAG: 4-phosphopantoate--beta-alanine ligase, partial [Pseudomonadota bacterium]